MSPSFWSWRYHFIGLVWGSIVLINTACIDQCYYPSKENEKQIKKSLILPALPSYALVATSIIFHLQHSYFFQLSSSTNLSNDITLNREGFLIPEQIQCQCKNCGEDCKEMFRGLVWDLWFCTWMGRTPKINPCQK